MQKMHRVMLLGTLLLIVLSIGLMGCNQQNKTTTLFTAGGSVVKAILDEAKADVAIDDIEHFYVTLTKIELDRVGNGEGDDGEEEAEEGEEEAEEKQPPTNPGNGGDNPAKVVVFEGELEVDLLDLLGVSEVISSGEIPPGDYTKIRLSIADPRLVLKDDLETELTNIQLTANSRLFVSQRFTIPEGNVLLALDFGGVKLVQLGNGNFVLTPQLQVDLSVQSADVQTTGTVVSFDGSTLVVSLGEDGELNVSVTEDTAFLPDDTDPPASAEDLIEGAVVTVQGTMFVDGSIVANSITFGV